MSVGSGAWSLVAMADGPVSPLEVMEEDKTPSEAESLEAFEVEAAAAAEAAAEPAVGESMLGASAGGGVVGTLRSLAIVPKTASWLWPSPEVREL